MAWSLAVRGFEGARWSDVPIIKSFVDPRLYRNDPFIWSLHDGTPAAYSYQLIAGVARALPALSLDQVLFILYVPASLASLGLLYLIGVRLTGSRPGTLLFLLLYVAGFRLVTIGSAILHSAETTPQTLALPLQLGALYALLLNRLPFAGLLMGLAFNLHAPTSVYMAGALGVYELLSLRRLGLASVGLSLALLGFAGSPTLIGSLLQHSDQLPLWALNLARAELATDISLTAHFSSRPWIAYNVLGLGLAAVGLMHAAPGPGRRLVMLFFVAVGLMCLGALVFFDLSVRTPLSTLVARLQLPRSAWIVNVFGLLYLAHLAIRSWQQRPTCRPLLLLLLAAMLTARSDFIPLDPVLMAAEGLLLAYFVMNRLAPRLPGWVDRMYWWAPLAIALPCAIAGVFDLELRELSFRSGMRSAIVFGGLLAGWAVSEALVRRGWAPVRALAPGVALAVIAGVGMQQAENWLYVSAHKGGLRAAAEFQAWARTSTPVDSVFLILPSEPNNNTFYENAERALFLVRERANQAVYFREHNLEFERRVKALGIEQPLRYRQDLDPAYRRLTEEQVRGLARDYGVTHFVPARAGSFSFPIIYQSGGWTVYEVR